MSNAWAIDPYKLAAQQHTMEGTIAVADMVRATKLLAAEQGGLAYKVAFSTDAEKLCVITGELDGEITLCCQRCLQTFAFSVHSGFVVSPVQSDIEAKQLPSSYEAVTTHDGKVDILELLEDELILALPHVPMHEVNECKAKIEVENEAQELNHPFQVLQKLKLKKNGQMAEDK